MNGKSPGSRPTTGYSRMLLLLLVVVGREQFEDKLCYDDRIGSSTLDACNMYCYDIEYNFEWSNLFIAVDYNSGEWWKTTSCSSSLLLYMYIYIYTVILFTRHRLSSLVTVSTAAMMTPRQNIHKVQHHYRKLVYSGTIELDNAYIILLYGCSMQRTIYERDLEDFKSNSTLLNQNHLFRLLINISWVFIIGCWVKLINEPILVVFNANTLPWM